MVECNCLWQDARMSKVDISEDLDRRIDALAASTSLTRGRIIEEALSYGRTLAWQERWAAGVREGLRDADARAFADEDEIAAVLNKYGQP